MTATTSADTAALAVAVGRYAARFHAAVGDRHHIASPLGAWLLLALVAGAAGANPVGADRTGARPMTDSALAEALGMPAEDAARHARLLLDDPHPAVADATAAWTRDAPPAAARWLAGLPAAAFSADRCRRRTRPTRGPGGTRSG